MLGRLIPRADVGSSYTFSLISFHRGGLKPAVLMGDGVGPCGWGAFLVGCVSFLILCVSGEFSVVLDMICCLELVSLESAIERTVCRAPPEERTSGE